MNDKIRLRDVPNYLLFRFQDYFMTRYDNLAGTKYSRLKWRILFELSGQGHGARRYAKATRWRKEDAEKLRRFFQ